MSFIDIMPIFTQSIGFKYTNYLLYCVKLEEAYNNLNFTKQEIISTLQYIAHDIENYNEEDLLDKLNNEFLNVGIIFLKYNNKYGLVKSSYPTEGIIAGEYIPEKRMTYIYINNNFISNFKDKKYNLLANGIIAISTHEDTHKQQIDHSNNIVKGLDSNIDIHTQKGFETYISSTIDIDAHAREVAAYLYNLGYSGSKIYDMINNHSSELMNCSSYKKYWDNFGIMTLYKGEKDKDIIKRLKIWKRFLSRISAYLTTTLKYKFTMQK